MLEPVPEPPFIPERRRVLPIERVGALIEIVICSGFPTQVLLILVMRGFKIPMWAADGRLSPRSSSPFRCSTRCSSSASY